MPPLLTTDRLVLRRFTPADADDLATLHANPAVMRFIDDGWAVRPETVFAETLPAILHSYAQLPPGHGWFVIATRSDGDFLGWVSLRPANSPGLSEYTGSELGYRLRPTAWGQGYATEAVRALVRHAFDELGAPRVVATTMAVHTASRRVMAKAGLRYVRTFTTDWPDPIPGSEHGDVEYALTRTDRAAENR